MFNTLIVQPIFNLLVFIYALLPGHNFGLAIIIFTVVVRILMWPLIKKQLHQAKAMRELQPEIRRIKKAAAGNRQKEQLMVMELYKEREINPFASFGILLLQLPILFGLYSGINRIVNDPYQIVDFAYPFLRDLGSLKEVAVDISRFDRTLLGVVDLTRPALENGRIYWAAMIIVIASAIVQYFQTKQLSPNDKDAKSLRQLLKEAGNGTSADSSEINAATGRFMLLLMPAFIFFISVGLASALPLYWLVGGMVAYLQQSYILRQDTQELTAATPIAKTDAVEGEVIAPPAEKTKKFSSKSKSKKSAKSNKRRKK